jgi:hypothetical protein
MFVSAGFKISCSERIQFTIKSRRQMKILSKFHLHDFPTTFEKSSKNPPFSLKTPCYTNVANKINYQSKKK